MIISLILHIFVFTAIITAGMFMDTEAIDEPIETSEESMCLEADEIEIVKICKSI